MNVKIVRLNTGEELLCAVKELNDESYHLTDVSIIVPTQEKSIALMPYMPYSNISKDGITVKKEFVMFTVDAQKDLANHHKEIYSSLVLPNSGLV